MENNRPLQEMISTTIQKVRDLVDANTIVGEPIVTEGVTLIPISKLSVGFVTGGSEFPKKEQAPGKDNPYGGGSGAGVKVTPVAFMVVQRDSVKLLPMTAPADTTLDRIVEMVPDLMDKVSGLFEKKAKGAKEEDFEDSK